MEDGPGCGVLLEDDEEVVALFFRRGASVYISRRVVAARRQDGRERQGGRGRADRRREEDETHASWRHRCQSRPPRGRAFLGKWITASTFLATGKRNNFFRQMEDDLYFLGKWVTT